MAVTKRLMSMGFSAAQAQEVVGPVTSTTAAGSAASDARVITTPKTLFTTASAGGAALPASLPGDEYELKNESGNTVTLYPSVTAGTVTINGTTSVSLATAKSCKVWFSSPTACHTNPTVPS
jgi:hypothetical protein